MKKLKPFILILMILILMISFIGEKGDLIENLQIPIGIGYDIEGSSSYTDYNVSILFNSYEDESKVTSDVSSTKAKNIAKTREVRQLKSGKRLLLGLNRVLVISEDYARYGIRNALDIWTHNTELNDRGLCVVCKGKAEDILNYKVKGYPNSIKFIEGMVQNLKQFNFFALQYTIMDLIVRVDAEGRNALLPYIEITDDGIKTTGLAIFNGDKLLEVSNIEEARIINILKEKGVKGIFTMQKDSEKDVNFYTISKRKVKCYNEDGKYNFVIDLNLKGQIVSNELSETLTSEAKELKIFEETMQDSIQKTCNETINKLKRKYSVDFLDLGNVAAAKFGRGTGVDWNKIICDSQIKVNVKFKVDTEGRGDY